MDRGIGRILDALKADGLEKDTIVVFLSDNGGAPEASSCNAPFRGAKRQHFEGGVRVPFIIRYPADKNSVVLVQEQLSTTRSSYWQMSRQGH